MPPDLQKLAETRQFSPDEIADRTRTIYETVLHESPIIDAGNFRRLHPDDLALLFEQYDRLFFDGGCRRKLGTRLLEFRLSKRMTRSGGKTTRYTPRNGDNPFYEIAVSTTLLFQTVGGGDRPVTATGLTCRDRLEALQRVFEHELVHLIEMLVWEKSNCAVRSFPSTVELQVEEAGAETVAVRKPVAGKQPVSIKHPAQFHRRAKYRRMAPRTMLPYCDRETPARIFCSSRTIHCIHCPEISMPGEGRSESASD